MTTAAGLSGLGSVWTFPGVYAPQMDTLLLARALRAERITAGMEVLDVCTGGGALALLAARMGARVSAVDISRRAVVTARVNALRGGHRIRVRRGDLSVAWNQTFDVVVSNPPYVPSEQALPPVRGRARAWDAGRDGRHVLDRVCAHAPSLLGPRGCC